MLSSGSPSDRFAFGPYKGVRALVLGSNGFIGRWVARKLCEAGAQVLLHFRDRKNAEPVFERYEITGDLFELDLYDLKNLENLLLDLRPTITFNLAGYGIDRSETNESSAHLINCQLPETVCATVARVRDISWTGRNVVHVGTAMEYGRACGNLSEDTPGQPTTLYGSSKLAGTTAMTFACRRTGTSGLTVRLFGVYGPGEPPQRLLPMLISESRSSERGRIPLTAGRHKRDFCYVEDVAEGLLRLGITSGEPGEVVNLATGRLLSVRHFVESAAKELGIPQDRLGFGALPTREDEMFHEPVMNRRLIDLTGWMPPVTIAEGVRLTLEREPSVSRGSAPAAVF